MILELKGENKKIEVLRQKLLNAAVCRKLIDYEVIAISERLDVEIVNYYRSAEQKNKGELLTAY